VEPPPGRGGRSEDSWTPVGGVPRETTQRDQRARPRRGDGGGERRQSLEGGADGFWRVAVLEERACFARVASVPGTRRRVRARGSLSRGCYLPRTRRREERSPDSPASPPAPLQHASRRRRPPRPHRTSPTPLPLTPPPERARSAPHPRPSARYAAAMSAQAQMRAMLDQLMGTSRDGKSLPEPWGWGRGWGQRRKGSEGAPGRARLAE
jgi:hypothetical protein